MNTDIGTQLLVIALLDELKDAIGRRDRDAAMRTIDHITTVAGRDYAARLMDGLIAATLHRITARPGDTGNGGSGAAR
jgi:hypothetical protein